MTEGNENGTTIEVEEVLIDQNHERGPGWFLITSYVVIVAVCLFYLFTFWDWQSDYDEQQGQLGVSVEQSAP